MTRIAVALIAAASLIAGPSAAAGLSSLYGCSAQGSANTTGAVVGGLLGALAGSQVSKKNSGLAAVVGAGVGAAIGNGIGCKMDRKGQQDARQAFQRALDTGRAQTWTDASSGATGRIEVLGSAPGNGGRPSGYNGRWRFADGVTPAQRVNNLGGEYAGDARVSVRAAPNPQAPVIDRVRAGEPVQIAGAVGPGGVWLAVVEDGLIQGYVVSSAVRPLRSYAGGGNGDACRLVQETITEPGRAPHYDRYTACRDANGLWNVNVT